MPHLRVTGVSVGEACKRGALWTPLRYKIGLLFHMTSVSYVLLCASICFCLCSMGVQALQTLEPHLCFYLAVVKCKI